MALDGTLEGLLDGRHASGCDGQEFSTCRPAVMADSQGRSELLVVYMAWCGDCGAADYEVV